VHEVQTVFDRGWEGVKNGDLLTRASDGFDVFVTADQKLQHQQNVPGFDIRVVVLAAVSNRIEDLLPLVPDALQVCLEMLPGEVRVVRASGPEPS
jgi:hypothetical protein